MAHTDVLIAPGRKRRVAQPDVGAALVTCPGCKKGTQFKCSPQLPAGAMLKLIDGPRPAEEWPDGWESWDNTVEAHRLLLQRIADNLPAYPGGHTGQGIVTSAGGAVYFTAAYVMVSVLRRLGCTLPVEWWHLGPEEMDPTMRALAVELGGVEVRDLKAVLRDAGVTPRMLGGWESKAWCLLHSRFAEALYLDADQVPAADPSHLFEEEGYLERGAVLWPDLPNHLGLDVRSAAWRACGLGEPESYVPVESGQLLVDKRRCWRELSLAAAINDHSDFFYRQCVHPGRRGVNHVYGDKSTFLLAWRKFGTPYASPRTPGWVGGGAGGAFLQHDLAGKLVFQHRCQPPSKWSLHGVNLPVPGVLHQHWCGEALDRLRSRWVGHPWDWSGQSEADAAAAAGVAGRRVLFRPGRPQRELYLDHGGAARGGEDGEHHWTLRHHAGEPFVVLAGRKRATAFLGPDGKGNWCDHGAGLFLTPAPPEGFRTPQGPEEIGLYADVIHRNEYRLPDQFGADDLVLDVGAHVGSFAWACLERGAGKVVCVEPNPDNLALLRPNLARYGDRATVLPYAAWRGDRPPTTLRLHFPQGAKHSGGGSVVGGAAGTSVLAVPLDQILLAATEGGRRRVRLLKLDCEGAEWPLLYTSRLLHLIDEVAGEWHLAWMDPVPEDCRVEGVGRFAVEGLAGLLRDAGFAVQTDETIPGALGHFFARRG